VCNYAGPGFTGNLAGHDKFIGPLAEKVNDLEHVDVFAETSFTKNYSLVLSLMSCVLWFELSLDTSVVTNC
jgi:hypothetical protein